MAYTLEELERDYDPAEHYMEAEDDSSFLFCLHNAWNGDAESQAIMGFVYSNAGHGVKVDYIKAEHFYLSAMDQGSAKAGYELGKLYLDKLRNYGGALNCFARSANQGCIPAMTSLGKCYFYGLGTKLDVDKAKFWLLKCVSEDKYEAPFFLALCLRDEDVRSAIGFAKIACENNYPQAYGVLADILYDEGEYRDAGEWLKLGAKRGNADAQRQLASWYENGMAFNLDLAEACIWYGRASRLGDEEAAENYERLSKIVQDDPKLELEKIRWREQDGDTQAMIELGDAYMYGFYGLAEDEKRGMGFYMRAGLKGNADGLFLAGKHYLNNNDFENGFKWMEKASNSGHILATLDLAGRYRDGEGVTVDHKKAYNLYAKALELSEPDSYARGFACVKIGDFHYYGVYVGKDYAVARSYYEKAISSGLSGAYVRLADMYYYGLGGERDCKRAYELYKAKANENYDPFAPPPKMWEAASSMYKSVGDCNDIFVFNARADLGLGNCRFFGEGTKRNLSVAVKNYYLASEHDIPEAGYNLALCYFYGAGVRKDPYNAKLILKRVAEKGYDKAKKLYKEIFGEDI